MSSSEDRVLDVLPEKSCSRGSRELPFIMSQALIDYNEKTLRDWVAFKAYPRYASLGLDAYPATYPAPDITELITLAIWQSPNKRLALRDIYEDIDSRFPPSTPEKGISRRGSIRHELSKKQCFLRMEKPASMLRSGSNHGGLWTIDPTKMKKNCPHRVVSKRPTAASSSTKKPNHSAVSYEYEPLSGNLPSFEWDSQTYQPQWPRQETLDLFSPPLPEPLWCPSDEGHLYHSGTALRYTQCTQFEITGSSSLAPENGWTNSVVYNQPSYGFYYGQSVEYDYSIPMFRESYGVSEEVESSSTGGQHSRSRPSFRYSPYTTLHQGCSSQGYEPRRSS